VNQETINMFVGLFVLTWLVLGVVVFILQRKPSVSELDSDVTRRFQDLQAQREVIEIYENAYVKATAIQRSGVDTLIGILRVIAPLTPSKADDAALALLEDITLPGDPPLPPTQPGDPESFATPEELAARLDPQALG